MLNDRAVARLVDSDSEKGPSGQGSVSNFGEPLSQSDSQNSSTEIPNNDEANALTPHVADNPRIGVFWYIVYTIKMTVILYITKGLYSLNPEI